MKLHAIVADIATAKRAVDQGATVIQLRMKGTTTDDRVAVARILRTFCPILIVNDDVTAAINARADAVHLGRGDTGHDRARAAGLRLGSTAATVAEARTAERREAWYIGTGPVWPTPTKVDAGAPIGLAGLAAVCRGTSLPVIAIGGIDASNAQSCIAAGAAGVAVVRAANTARTVLAALHGDSVSSW